MLLETRCIPAFEDNYIWLFGTPGVGQVAIVDPGDAEPVIAVLEQGGLAPIAILITHHHLDHTGGAAELSSRYRIPVYGPADPRIGAVTEAVGEGDDIAVAGASLRVMETPGHTRSHICYAGGGVLFSGDTLFTAGCGRLFEGTPQQMHASLEKIAALPDETLVYCAHEYTLANLAFARVAEPGNPHITERLAEATARRSRGEPTVPAPLGLERVTNPFLRCREPEVIAGAERFSGHVLSDPITVFGAVRSWKDSLD